MVYQSVSAKLGCLLQMEITRAVKGKAKNNCVGYKMKTIRLAARAEAKC